MAGRARSLRLELVASLAVVLFMAVVSLSLAAELLGQRRHGSLELARLQDHARGIAVLAAREVRGGQVLDSDGLTQLLHQSTASALGVVSARIFALRDGSVETLASVGITEEIPPPADAAARVDERVLESQGLLVIDEPVPTLGGPPGEAVVLRVVAQPSAWASGHAWPETLVVAGGVGLVLLLLGFLLVELQVLRPLRAVEVAAERVADGDLAVEVGEDGATEFRSVAGTFNRMTRALQRQREELSEQRGRLQRSEQLAAVGRLAAGVAHEVGNPLAAILGYTEFLLDPRSELSVRQRELVGRIHGQTERIQAIVARLLDYARPSATSIQPVALTAHARDLIGLLDGDPRLAGVRVEVRGADDVRALADPGLLHQVLLNLVVNAAHAARDGESEAPRVEVVVRRAAGPDAEIEVRDNGTGIDAAVRARLFEPFFTTRPTGEGSGLGLAVSRGLVESMGGRIDCLEPSEGTPTPADELPGATFRVTLPGPDGARLSEA